jgi:hypothetical protein
MGIGEFAMLKRHWWLLATTAIFAAGAANAQSPAPDLDKVDRMQRQMEQLQEQMKQVKSELLEAKKKAAEAKEAKAEVPPAFGGAYGADKPFPAKAPSIVDRVKLTWGGFLAAETVYRQHNSVADMATNFNSIPYPFSPQFGENEFHGSGRHSRLSLLAEGVLDPVQKLSGYYEMDFLGVGVTSNYNQSNSWAPRIRQAYFTYDNTEWGFHFLGGQAWSLLTQNQVGITPRKENIPLTIDSAYVVGFDFTRNWQLRVVKDFGSWASFGLSVENPAELVYAGNGAVANGGNVGGWLVNFQNAGNSALGSSGYVNNFAADVAPDIIGKAAFDPGWGHYEVFGIARFFNDNTLAASWRRLPSRPAEATRPKQPAYVPRSSPPPTRLSLASRARGPKAAMASAVRCCCPSPNTSTFNSRPCTARALAVMAPRNCPMSLSRPMGRCRPSKRSTHWAGLSCIPGQGSTSTLMPEWRRRSPIIGAALRGCGQPYHCVQIRA